MTSAFEWQACPPEEQGMDSDALSSMREGLAARGTKALFLARRDKVVLEWYAPDHGPDRPHYTASLAKAIVGGTSLMFALSDDRLNVDDLAADYVPAWRGDPLKSRVTVRHLATHSSGVEDAEISQADRDRAVAEGATLTDHHMSLPGWKGAFWRREPDPFTVSRDEAPIVFEPGTQYAYSNPGIAMLAYVVTASLRGGPENDIRAVLKARLMDPIGVQEGAWSIGYGQAYEVDGLRLYGSWGGGSYTARAVARVGRLMLRKGDWEGTQLVPADWVERATEHAGTPVPDRPPGNPAPGSGLGWWTNSDGVWPRVPRDAFAGSGAGNQLLMVIPSLDLVIVRNGSQIGDPQAGEGHWGGVERHLLDPLMQAIG